MPDGVSTGAVRRMAELIKQIFSLDEAKEFTAKHYCNVETIGIFFAVRLVRNKHQRRLKYYCKKLKCILGVAGHVRLACTRRENVRCTWQCTGSNSNTT